MKVFNFILTVISLTVFICPPSKADAPSLRIGIGYSPLKIDAGEIYNNTPLESYLTLNPMFLWESPSFKSRVGLHFLLDTLSPYGLMVTSGIGVTWIFYPRGLSASHETSLDNIDVRKTRVSPYITAQVTPTRMTLAQPLSTVQRGETPKYFSAFILETSLGAGVDYPMSENYVVFGGINYRFAAITKGELHSAAIHYSGLMIQFGILSNFY